MQGRTARWLCQRAFFFSNRLCDALRQATLELSCGKALRITASIGVYVGVPEAGTAWQAMLGAADVAMYQAKRDGRDRVALHVDRQPKA